MCILPISVDATFLAERQDYVTCRSAKSNRSIQRHGASIVIVVFDRKIKKC